jgi:hypothetical protein
VALSLSAGGSLLGARCSLPPAAHPEADGSRDARAQDFFAHEAANHAQLLEAMRVLPPDGPTDRLSQEEWDVAHTYMVLALRKKPPGGAAHAAPPSDERNPGHRRVDTERDIVYLNADDAPAARKRPRDEGGEGDAAARERHRPREGAAPADERKAETREQVVYGEGDDSLFD